MTDRPFPDRDDTSGPTKGAMSAAERQRRCRARKKEGLKMWSVVFTKKYTDDLVSDGDGRIAAKDLNDPKKLGAEIEEDYFCQKYGEFQSGPIATGTSTSP